MKGNLKMLAKSDGYVLQGLGRKCKARSCYIFVKVFWTGNSRHQHRSFLIYACTERLAEPRGTSDLVVIVLAAVFLTFIVVKFESSLLHHIPLLECLSPPARPSKKEIGNDGQDCNTH